MQRMWRLISGTGAFNNYVKKYRLHITKPFHSICIYKHGLHLPQYTQVHNIQHFVGTHNICDARFYFCILPIRNTHKCPRNAGGPAVPRPLGANRSRLLVSNTRGRGVYDTSYSYVYQYYTSSWCVVSTA